MLLGTHSPRTSHHRLPTQAETSLSPPPPQNVTGNKTSEWCTHASVVEGHITYFVSTCPSNDMLVTYENVTTSLIGQAAEEWTRTSLERLQVDPTDSGKKRRLTGHFSFDFISSTVDGQLYPLECNAHVHTATILLSLSEIASCYLPTPKPDPNIDSTIICPLPITSPRFDGITT